ncbi:CYFA0S06e00276g1_1 [Cyberlindnera fabianii]|uniref:CYFA0S06e00276g1_1 n=1 Tax=Cyberlindnera fabianii TaxID=36022 RepID=A0A061B209_CYBFA|nr:CYFA0S06e00276g1_1 [Cyberlindnera fabianii]
MPIPVPTPTPRRRSSLSSDSTHVRVLDYPVFKPCFRCERKHNAQVTNKLRKINKLNNLLGSMQESLLHGMTSGMESKPYKFQAVLSTGVSTTKAIKMSFEAKFYTWQDGSSSPFVGTINLSDEGFVCDKFPGIPVKARSRIQLMICNAEGSLLRHVIMRYNVRKLKDGCKVFIRQSTDDYTMHVNFINVGGSFYIFGDMKVIFHNHVLNEENEGEMKRVVGKPSKVDLSYYLDGCQLCTVIDESDTIHEDLNQMSLEVDSDLSTEATPSDKKQPMVLVGSGTKELL